MTFICRNRDSSCIDDVCRSMNDCAWPWTEASGGDDQSQTADRATAPHLVRNTERTMEATE